MKKTFLTILALGFIFTLQAQIDNRLNGQWFLPADIPILQVEYNFNNGHFEISGSDGPQSRGTYTTSSGTITLNTTHYFGGMYNSVLDIWELPSLEERWYTAEEIRAIFTELYFVDMDTLFNTIAVFNYSIGTNTLTLTHLVELDGETFRLEAILQRR